MSADNKTEKPTQKRRRESRAKGQVARSADISTAVVVIVGLATLALLGPHMFGQMKDIVGHGLQQTSDPSLASPTGVGKVGMWALLQLAAVIAPLALAVTVAAFLANVAQVRLSFSPQALKPSFKRINPTAGFKRLFGPQSLVEGGKALTKTAVIATVVFLALWPKLKELGSLVGLPPGELMPKIGGLVVGIGFRAAAVIAVVAAADYAWQRWKHEKSLRMSKDEVRQEARESDLSPELRGALRRKQMERARRRMLAEVPTADVVLVNPTHYAVALRYDGTVPAPQVVAKGVDHIALQIRRVAAENEVPVLSNPPLARALYREVELDAVIPEAFFAAVAEVLAFVYRTARRRPRIGRRAS
jgi:flagellar biosynthetic protein FlhB